VQLTAVNSQVSHGNAGTFAINMPLSGPPGIECRVSSSAGQGNYTITFSFSNTLTNVDTATASQNGCPGVSVTSATINGSNYVVNLSGVCNAGYVGVALNNVNDSAGNHSDSVASPQMAFLIGDTNGDGFVNSADIGQTKSQSGQAVTNANFRQDVNGDGFINSADIGLVKSKSGIALP
jgi:hypothetical protein